MRKPYGAMWIMVLLSAVLMSLPWLVPHCGFLALIGLVPLLSAERVASQNGVKHFWIWHYSCFVLWNAFTTFWVCNATVGGGIFAVLANALQMSVVFGLFRLSKKRLGGILPYLFLAFAWIAWERWYLVSAQISWPWLVLGNAFARSIRSIQWYEFTGTLGGSLWIWAANLSAFGLMVSILEGTWFRWKGFAKWSSVLGALLVFALPFAASAHLWRSFEEDSEGTVAVTIAQPNFDPYQKFTSLTQAQQTEILLGQFSEALAEDSQATPVLLIAPETFTGDIWLNDISSSPTWKSFQEFLKGHPKANLLFGASTYRYYAQRSAPSILARESGSGWVENHNTAFVTDTSGREELFHKSKLVVGVEMTPYPKFFVPIDNKLGGLMGRCIGQPEISCLHYSGAAPAGIPFGCAVCYESVYPEYCTGYVRKGAEFMTIITNDAWWGDTPGYKQHASYASLRAIELRRDIARCGNTGISGVINQRGEYLSQSDWWQRETLSGEVNLSKRETFFVRYGDIVGRICTFAFLLMLAFLLVSFLIPKRR
ncbi:MAG: apolipoprotein N-acyltransferase [Bacteroidales bacterium]|nr:apolipoprotein N-acyltransferase [Bacteroidales bacterium]